MIYLVSIWYFEILQALKMFQQCSGTTLQAPIWTLNSVSKVSCISGQYAKYFHHIRMEIHCNKLLLLQEKTSLQTERAVKWTLIALKPLPSEHQSQTFGCRLKWRQEKRFPRCPWCCPCLWHSPLQAGSNTAHLDWHPRGMDLSRYVDQQVWKRERVGSFHFFSRYVRSRRTWKLSELQSCHEIRLWLFLFSLSRISYGTSLHPSGVCDELSTDYQSGVG